MPYSEIKALNRMRTQREDANIVLPNEPIRLTENMTQDGNTITWQPPQVGADFIECYAIIVTERGTRMGQNPIEYLYHTSSNETEFQIMIPNNVPYDVHVHGLWRTGRTASSDVLHHSGLSARLAGGAEICRPRRTHSGRVEVRQSSIIV